MVNLAGISWDILIIITKTTSYQHMPTLTYLDMFIENKHGTVSFQAHYFEIVLSFKI